jgi:hypothetical protein
MSHDAVNRYLSADRARPNAIWKSVKGDVVASPNGYLVFDDTVLDKHHSHRIELVRKQYSGNAHGVIKGIGVVNCVYVNPDIDAHWIVDFRLFAPDEDGKTKLTHVKEMLANVMAHKKLPIAAVLMDTWYATRKLMQFIENQGLIYYCPIKSNRLVDDSEHVLPFKNVSALEWSEHELAHGKHLYIKDFPKSHRVKLFRIVVSTHRTDFVVTNDLSQNDTPTTKSVCAWRWKIEQFHREVKQLTGLERCQCRKARIQRNHITCAFLVWVRLLQFAKQTKTTVYQVKQRLLDNYMFQQLKNPDLPMAFA